MSLTSRRGRPRTGRPSENTATAKSQVPADGDTQTVPSGNRHAHLTRRPQHSATVEGVPHGAEHTHRAA